MVGVGILILAVALVWKFAQSNAAPSNSQSQSTPGAFADSVASTTDSSTPDSITQPTIQAPPNSKLYQSSAYHFSVYYPDHLSMDQQNISGNSSVILFKDKARSEGFQIFVTPYGDSKITEARFKMDEPSGVMNSPQNITIDGTPATEFLSTNPAMGASREIWFLHGGFLYEVTTPQPLDPWLLSILQTWKFN